MKRLFVFMMVFVCLISFLLLISQDASAWEGKVFGVADGDTVTVLSNNNDQIRIRLYGIDAPESAQAFGAKAKQSLANMVFGKVVRVEEKDRDRYGRVVARLYVGSLDVNAEQIRQGMAWVYRHYCRDGFCSGWIGLEAAAKNGGVGLWNDKEPVPPWDWRRDKRSPSAVSATGGSPAVAVPSDKLVYHGNQRSRVFHHPRCKDYQCPNCIIELPSREEAVRQGFRPCGVCRP